jgi:hypothetical protein
MKIFKMFLFLISIAMLFSIVGCNDDDDKNPAGPGNNKYDGTLNATVSGDFNLNFQCKTAYGLIVKPANGQSGSMHIQGSVTQGSDTYLIDIQVYHDAATGTYDMTFPMQTGQGLGTISKNSVGNVSESGSITFTQVNDSHMVGTFEFTAWRMEGVGQKVTVVVSSGSFNVPVIDVN